MSVRLNGSCRVRWYVHTIGELLRFLGRLLCGVSCVVVGVVVTRALLSVSASIRVFLPLLSRDLLLTHPVVWKALFLLVIKMFPRYKVDRHEVMLFTTSISTTQITFLPSNCTLHSKLSAIIMRFSFLCFRYLCMASDE